jgi:hypothetical protein
MAAGTSAQNMINAMSNLTSLSSALAQTANVSSLLGRMSTNIGLLGQ